MLGLSGHQREGDPYETLTEECPEIVSSILARGHYPFLDRPPFSAFQVRSDARWTARRVALAAVLMAWGSAGSLCDRFTAARDVITEMFPGRRRVGRSYQGFLRALLGFGERLRNAVGMHLRTMLQVVAGRHWTREGFVAFAADGSRMDCPRTVANEKAFGCGGRKGTGPQMWLTTLWHMGTGLPWSWRIGPSTDAERTHLREMLEELPPTALLVADAGFTGYELLCEILRGGRSFLVRVGSNVHLLRDLGYAEVETDGTVYLWPQASRKKGCPPLVLRLIVLERKGKKMHLLTNLPAEKLGQPQARMLYEMRWGVEVFYRSMKQTLCRRKTLSRAPRQARAELGWTLVGLQLLGLLSVERIIGSGKDPLSWSVALSLRVVRSAMRGRRPPGQVRGRLANHLVHAIKDRYHRAGPKNPRPWPHKKREAPPGDPRIRKANQTEVNAAKRIKAKKDAA
jgi:hypothetical protein